MNMKFILLLLSFIASADIQHKSFEIEFYKRIQSLYKTQKWDEFFGSTLYARVKFPLSPLKDKITLLEILALIRHCQFQEVNRLLKASLKHAYKENIKKFEAIEETLKTYSSDIPSKKCHNETFSTKSFKASLKVKRNFWPVSDEILKKDINPYRIRRHVVSLCEKEKI